MTAKYTVLDSQVLATSAASVTFNSIPGGYKDLVLQIETTMDTLASGLEPRFNSDSGSNYSYVTMYANVISASSGSGTATHLYPGTNASFTGATYTIEIMDYSASDKHKSALIRTGSAGSYVTATAGRWANTSAISSIVCALSDAADFGAGSTFRLLGVN